MLNYENVLNIDPPMTSQDTQVDVAMPKLVRIPNFYVSSRFVEKLLIFELFGVI